VGNAEDLDLGLLPWDARHPQASVATTQPASSSDASVLPPNAEAPEPYTVKPGDSLKEIAARLLGDAGRWTELYALNRDVIGANPDLVRPGQVLQLPGDPNAAVPQGAAGEASFGSGTGINSDQLERELAEDSGQVQVAYILAVPVVTARDFGLMVNLKENTDAHIETHCASIFHDGRKNRARHAYPSAV
jgi:LysM repeat protein